MTTGERQKYLAIKILINESKGEFRILIIVFVKQLIKISFKINFKISISWGKWKKI